MLLKGPHLWGSVNRISTKIRSSQEEEDSNNFNSSRKLKLLKCLYTSAIKVSIRIGDRKFNPCHLMWRHQHLRALIWWVRLILHTCMYRLTTQGAHHLNLRTSHHTDCTESWYTLNLWCTTFPFPLNIFSSISTINSQLQAACFLCSLMHFPPPNSALVVHVHGSPLANHVTPLSATWRFTAPFHTQLLPTSSTYPTFKSVSL